MKTNTLFIVALSREFNLYSDYYYRPILYICMAFYNTAVAKLPSLAHVCGVEKAGLIITASLSVRNEGG